MVLVFLPAHLFCQNRIWQKSASKVSATERHLVPYANGRPQSKRFNAGLLGSANCAAAGSWIADLFERDVDFFKSLFAKVGNAQQFLWRAAK